MTIEEDFRATYPSIIEVVDGADFHRDMSRFESIADPADARGTFKHLKESKPRLHSRRLLSRLFETVYCPFLSYAIPDLEQDLKWLRTIFPVPILRTAFMEKLLDDRFDNTLTEAAAATVFTRVFDEGTIQFEKPLEGSRKNPDMTAHWDGCKAIAEVTTMNIEYPPRPHADLTSEIESVCVAAGFNLVLRCRLCSTEQAQSIRELIEDIFSARLAIGDYFEVNGLRFCRQNQDGYNCDEDACPIRYIEFYPDTPDYRAIQEGVFSANLLSAQDKEFLDERFPHPSDVVPVQFGDPSDRLSHRERPFSESVWSMINAKLPQCEAGAVNLIVLGVPNPMFDLDVPNALYGSFYITLAVRRAGPTGTTLDDPTAGRAPGGVFSLPSSLPADLSAEERQIREDQIKLFERISGVLLFRVVTYASCTAGRLIHSASVHT